MNFNLNYKLFLIGILVIFAGMIIPITDIESRARISSGALLAAWGSLAAVLSFFWNSRDEASDLIHARSPAEIAKNLKEWQNILRKHLLVSALVVVLLIVVLNVFKNFINLSFCNP